MSLPESAPDDASLAFGPFVLDRRERRLTRDGGADGSTDVPIQGRAFDLVAHLAAHAGHLVRKDDLFAAVWPGVVVGDAALTQAMRVARKALGDDAAAPVYIETVAGHGYRFVAPVTQGAMPSAPEPAETPIAPIPERDPVPRVDEATSWDAARPVNVTGAVVGGVAAALVGGVLYGLALGADGPHPLTTLVSVAAFSVTAGGLGAGAVALGAGAVRGTWRAPLAGALAGGTVGALGEAVGRSLLVTVAGEYPGDLTGGIEGLAVGAALGLAFAPWRRGRIAAVVTAVATMAVFVTLALAGRPTFAGSLDAALATPLDPLRLDVLAPGGLTRGLRVLLGALEGLVFGLGVGVGSRT